MWKVIKTIHGNFMVGKKDKYIKTIYTNDWVIFLTPYQSEAKELADKLNGDSDANRD
jgi:hypothetical protein